MIRLNRKPLLLAPISVQGLSFLIQPDKGCSLPKNEGACAEQISPGPK